MIQELVVYSAEILSNVLYYSYTNRHTEYSISTSTLVEMYLQQSLHGWYC